MSMTQWHMSGPARRVDRYAILDTLGKGYTSKVKRGLDTVTGQTVALKVMYKLPEDDPERHARKARRLQTEIRALALCRGHPHTVLLREVLCNTAYPKRDGSMQPAHVVVTELCERGELFSLLREPELLPAHIAREYFRQLVTGIAFCHGQGIYHRDLKPQNLLLDVDFTLKIADFGFAATASSFGARNTSIVGSPMHMAPEVLQGTSYDSALADVWSAGSILFMMLAGDPPMERAHTHDWWFRALKLGRHDLFWESHERSHAGFPVEAKHLITAMLAVEPARRITMLEIMNHPFVTAAQSTSVAEELRREMSFRYEHNLAHNHVARVISESTMTAGTEPSTGQGSRGVENETIGGGVGMAAAAAADNPPVAGVLQGRYFPTFEQATLRSRDDEHETGPLAISCERVAATTGGFLTRGPAIDVVRALERVLHDMGAEIAGVHRDGTRTLRTSYKISAVIPKDTRTGGGDVRIVAKVYRQLGKEIAENNDVTQSNQDLFLVVLRRNRGDYMRYLRAEETIIGSMATTKLKRTRWPIREAAANKLPTSARIAKRLPTLARVIRCPTAGLVLKMW